LRAVAVSPADPASTVVPLDDRSRVGEARRVAGRLAAEVGLSEAARSDVGIVATELATNVLRHAERGTLVLRRLGGAGGGIELVCLDAGPGMRDPVACLADGYSSAGSMGTGLGAMRRLAHGFDLYSAPGRGTAIVTRFWARRDAGTAAAAAMLAGLAVPFPGETECGDAWAARSGPAGTAIVLADGLGHGPAAAAASAAALEIFQAHPAAGPGELVALMHAGMRSTRGAAVAVASSGPLAGEGVRFAGVGNVSAVLARPQDSRSFMSHNGTVGLQARKIQELSYPWPAEAVLVMHSDGLQSHWRLDQYAGLTQRDAGLIAGVLYRDFVRGRDDVSVVVQRNTPPVPLA
jgi:anti-sigma regulatory factor (Ser/Thr protein kinase)